MTKRYLMRGAASPLDAFSPEYVIKNHSTGKNVGNLLYAFGVYRTLMTEDTVIDMDYNKAETGAYTDAEIDKINETYDAYICPMADAFRDSNRKNLLNHASFFKKLKIPCYVIGVGMRADYDAQKNTKYAYDEEVREFVKAVLDKNSILGLRGERTADYLKYLGFREDTDYRAIGCPSMYSFGRELKQRTLPPLNESGNFSSGIKISFNLNQDISYVNVLEFLANNMERFPNHCYVDQQEAGLKLLYYGTPFTVNNVSLRLVPREIEHPLLAEGGEISDFRQRSELAAFYENQRFEHRQ